MTVLRRWLSPRPVPTRRSSDESEPSRAPTTLQPVGADEPADGFTRETCRLTGGGAPRTVVVEDLPETYSPTAPNAGVEGCAYATPGDDEHSTTISVAAVDADNDNRPLEEEFDEVRATVRAS